MGKAIVLIDGENLVFRYQSMKDNEGYKPHKENVHIQDLFVWTPDIAKHFLKEVIRVWVYTSAVGDPNTIQQIRKKISAIPYQYGRGGQGDYYGEGTLVPRVFKKEKRAHKSRLVDIHIAIDAMRHSFSESVDQIVFFTGDGDFVALFEAIMRRGKTVHVGAFSSGLDPRIPTVVDRFIDLDTLFFEQSSPTRCTEAFDHA